MAFVHHWSIISCCWGPASSCTMKNSKVSCTFSCCKLHIWYPQTGEHPFSSKFSLNTKVQNGSTSSIRTSSKFEQRSTAVVSWAQVVWRRPAPGYSGCRPWLPPVPDTNAAIAKARAQLGVAKNTLNMKCINRIINVSCLRLFNKLHIECQVLGQSPGGILTVLWTLFAEIYWHR